MLSFTYFHSNMVTLHQHLAYTDNRDTNFANISNILEKIPYNITVLIFESEHGNYPIDTLPSLMRFIHLKIIHFKKIKTLRILPEFSETVNYLNIRECDIETLINVPRRMKHLSLDTNRLLDMSTIPTSIEMFECMRQHLGTFSIPQDNMLLWLSECTIETITNISICLTYYETNPFYCLDMYQCISPYQYAVDDILKHIPPHHNRLHEYSIEIVNAIIEIEHNKQLRIELGQNAICIQKSILRNTPQIDMSPIETVFVLGSNDPRRMMEFV
jgi:hypothetical protein